MAESIAILVTDAELALAHLQDHVRSKEWEQAQRNGRALLSVASRLFARISACVDAEAEMRAEK